MTPEQLALVRSSYASLGSDATAMAEEFYQRLFAADPSTRELFSLGPEIMAEKFVAELDAIVDAISSFDAFRLRVGELGWRHAAYGVQIQHYRAVGDALVGALAAHLAGSWDESLDAAWRRAYNLVAETMISAQREATRRSSRQPAPARRDAAAGE